jgi:DNA polymerase-1
MSLNYIQDLKGVSDFLIKLNDSEVLGFDTETTGLDPFNDRLILVQFSFKNNDVYVINVRNIGYDHCKSIFDKINQLNIKLIAHNATFDIKFIYTHFGIMLKNVHDTMVAEAILTAGLGKFKMSLAEVIHKYIGVEITKDTRKDFFNFPENSVVSYEMVAYAGIDVIHLMNIYKLQMKAMEDSKSLDVYNLEMMVIPAVASMEINGVSIDADKWKALVEKAEIDVKELDIKIREFFVENSKISGKTSLEVAHMFKIPVKLKRDIEALSMIVDASNIKKWLVDNINLGSPKQLKTCLHNVGIKVADTNEKTLRKLPKNEVIELIFKYREYDKKITSFGMNILELVNSKTGRIHTHYSSIGTATGRFSSSVPNMQQIPSTNDYRNAFIAGDGKSFVAMDYSQQELRLAGAISNEDKFIEAYINNTDLHQLTASLLFGIPLNKVEKSQRSIGKSINFAILYGTTDYGLKYNLDVSMEDARRFINNFYNGYPKLAMFKAYAEERIIELGFSVTPLGRRRYFTPRPMFITPDELEKYYGKLKREGFNHIIQGSGADITKMALQRMFFENPFGDKFKLILQVHDEIVTEVDDSVLEDGIKFMKSIMEQVEQRFLGKIPAAVDYKVGKMWSK